MADHRPSGHHTVVPYLGVTDVATMIDFYKRAFDAQELMVIRSGEIVTHAEMRIGDCVVYLKEELPGFARARAPRSLGGTTVTFALWTDNVDLMYQRALDAGATSDSPPSDAYWGDRFARVTDPCGHGWSLSTHLEDVPAEEQERRSREYFLKAAKTEETEESIRRATAKP